MVKYRSIKQRSSFCPSDLMETFSNTSLDGHVHRDNNVDIEVLAPLRVSGYTFRNGLFVNALRKQARSEG